MHMEPIAIPLSPSTVTQSYRDTPRIFHMYQHPLTHSIDHQSHNGAIPGGAERILFVSRETLLPGILAVQNSTFLINREDIVLRPRGNYHYAKATLHIKVPPLSSYDTFRCSYLHIFLPYDFVVAELQAMEALTPTLSPEERRERQAGQVRCPV